MLHKKLVRLNIPDYLYNDNRYYEKIGKNEPVDITDDLPFDIPDSWEWIRIDSVFNIINGFTPLRSNEKFWKDGTISWFTVEDIHRQGKYIENTKVKINSCACSQDRISPKNSFLLCCTASIGEFALTKISLTTNQQFNALSLKDYSQNIYNMEFILAIGGYFKNVLMSIAGTTTFPFVSTKKLGRILLPLPPFAEQQRIIEKIESMEPYLAQYDKIEKQLTKLESEIKDKLKKSILQYAIQGKLVKQDPNDEPASVLLERIKAEKEKLIKEGKIKRDKNESFIYQGDDKNYYENVFFKTPKNWAWTSIGNISNSYIGLTYKPSNISNDGIIVLRSSNIQNGKLDLSDIIRVSCNVNKKLLVNNNDIIICARNGSKKLVGKSALITNIKEKMTFGAFMAICKTHFYKYVYLYLQSPLFYQQLSKNSGTTTINQLTQKAFNTFLIPMPPLNEQQKIVDKIDRVFNVL